MDLTGSCRTILFALLAMLVGFALPGRAAFGATAAGPALLNDGARFATDMRVLSDAGFHIRGVSLSDTGEGTTLELVLSDGRSAMAAIVTATTPKGVPRYRREERPLPSEIRVYRFQEELLGALAAGPLRRFSPACEGAFLEAGAAVFVDPGEHYVVAQRQTGARAPHAAARALGEALARGLSLSDADASTPGRVTFLFTGFESREILVSFGPGGRVDKMEERISPGQPAWQRFGPAPSLGRWLRGRDLTRLEILRSDDGGGPALQLGDAQDAFSIRGVDFSLVDGFDSDGGC